MGQAQSRIISWVGSHVLPHEAEVRAWMKRAMSPDCDPDDVIQEAYCRLAALTTVDHIDNPKAYFYRTVRNVVLEQVRRSRVVRIEAVAEIEALEDVEGQLSPERIVTGRRELARVRQLIEALPDRCRRIFEMRKIEGVSQREIARRLGVTENIVENEAVRGLRHILKALAEGGEPSPAAGQVHGHEDIRTRRHD